MVYGRYNELVFMGVFSWFIKKNIHITGGPHPVPILIERGCDEDRWMWVYCVEGRSMTPTLNPQEMVGCPARLGYF